MSDNGKIALVTGAGSGIGRAVALALIREGYSVALAGRRKEALEETLAAGAPPRGPRAGRRKEAREETLAAGSPPGARGLAVPTDVSDPASVDALFAKVRQGFGR